MVALKILKWMCGLLMALLMLGAEVGPEEAGSNLSKWIEVMGVGSIPAWFKNPLVDTWIFWIGLIGFMGCVVWIIYPSWIGHHIQTYFRQLKQRIQQLIIQRLQPAVIITESKSAARKFWLFGSDHSSQPNWYSDSPQLEFRPEWHRKVEVFDDASGEFIGHKTVYWIDILKRPTAQTCPITVELKGIQVVGNDSRYPDHTMLLPSDYDFHPVDNAWHEFYLSEECPRKSVYIVSRLDGSDYILIEGTPRRGSVVEFPHHGNTYRLRIGVNWSGRTFPLVAFLVWVTQDGGIEDGF